MKAEELRELIREVLKEQEVDVGDKKATKLATGAMSASARTKASRERIATTSDEFTPQEQKIVDQLEKFIADLAAKEGVDLPKHRAFIERAMKLIQQRMVK